MSILLGFILFMAGTVLGVTVMCLCNMASKSDIDERREAPGYDWGEGTWRGQ